MRPIFLLRDDALLRARHGDELTLLAVPPNAVLIASAPAIDSCEYARPPPSIAGALRRELGCSLGRQLGVEEREDDSRMARPSSSNIEWPSLRTRRAGPLGHGPQVHALAQVVHVLEVLAPPRVDDLEDHVALELAE